ncbi:hypothetical protein HYW55_03520 [Candidatus Gottesmanbacteria bacterium]|nr:hypothetical protein [Candidatus Gottesmanbacteria bacterium]
MRNIKRIRLIFFVLLLLSSLSVRELFSPGFFPMHDDTQPARIYEMAKSLSFGQFPVRWVADLGYGMGYPLFNFYAPLPYYIGAAFTFLGIDLLVATKLMIAIGVVLAAVFMYLLAREISGSELGGFLSSMLYLYGPYHAVQVYVRGAIGELYAYAFLPLFVWGVVLSYRQLFREDEGGQRLQQGVLIGSLGLSAVLLSHNVIGFITLLFTSIFILAVLLYGIFRRKLFYCIPIFTIVLLAFGLSAFFVLPAFAEKHLTKVEELIQGGSNFRQHFVFLSQLWDSPWGYGGSAMGYSDGMSFKIGKVHLFFGLLSFTLFLVNKRRIQLSIRQTIFYIIMCGLFLASIYSMLDISLPMYETVPFFPFIQYPWRFLVFTLFALSVFSSLIFLSRKTRVDYVFLILACSLIIGVNGKYFRPKTIVTVTSNQYKDPFMLRNTYSKISDEYMPKEFIRPDGFISESFNLISSPKGVGTIMMNTPTEKTFQMDTLTPQKIVTNIAYFPGWMVYVGEEIVRTQNSSGRVAFDISRGQTVVKVKLVSTPIQTVGNAISIFTVFLLLYVTLFWKRVWVWLQRHL